MADSKVSALTENTAPAAEDEIYIRDISESTVANQSKRVTFDTLFSQVLTHESEILVYEDDILVL